MSKIKNYVRFSLADREEISRELKIGNSYQTIGLKLNKDKSSISREVSRDGMNRFTYRAHKAHWHAQKEKKQQGRKRKILLKPDLKDYVLEKLRVYWSPEQIAKELKGEYPDDMTMRISHEAIYAYIYVLPRGSLKRELLLYLRQQRIYRRRNCKNQSRKEPKMLRMADMISIEERPKEVQDRIIPGHWEGDLIIGRWKRSALGTLVERTSRTTILVPLKKHDAVNVRKSFAKELKTIPAQMKLSLTYDQGREMSQHGLFTQKTRIKVFFAHPGCPWERGTNENTNGLIRQFFPKGTDFSQISYQRIKQVQDLLNGRPRKVLGWRKPYQVFNQLVALES